MLQYSIFFSHVYCVVNLMLFDFICDTDLKPMHYALRSPQL